jgi:hypothetical protein
MKKAALFMTMMFGGVLVIYAQKMPQKNIPIVGHSFKADFGNFVFKLRFDSEESMTYTALMKSDSGKSETVTIRKTQLRPNVYMIYWKEKSGNTVTHVEDFEKQIIYTNITVPNGNFINLKGTLTSLKD